jgi:parallel beta-helix repeat protein
MNHQRNSTVFILILSFIIVTSSILPASQTTNEDHIIYVDDDNTNGPWDGTLNHPFLTINDAIESSSEDYIIFVFSGEYNEHLSIDKNIKLEGENNLETVINGEITIKGTDSVTLTQFTITSEEDTSEDLIGININQSENTKIFKNTIMDQHIGILLSQSSQSIIKENTIEQNTIGLDICSSTKNLIYGNTIQNNILSNIILYFSDGNLLTQNMIRNAEHNLQFHTSKDTITQNYWGNSKSIQLINGYQTIPVFNIVIPWIKILFNPLTSEDQISVNALARMKTSLGSMNLELFQDNMPITTQNFIDLTHLDFFNGLVFHRVIDDFVIQGGGFDTEGKHKDSPLGTIPLETHPDVTHVDGAISMARTNDPDSATSQFFICDGAQHGLDGNYAAFGVILTGFETLRSIASVETTRKHFMDDWPVEDVIITDVIII